MARIHHYRRRHAEAPELEDELPALLRVAFPGPYVQPISADRFGGSRVVTLARHQTGGMLGYDLTPTLLDLAGQVHKDYLEGLKFARIWGEGKHDGQSVSRDHQVNDGDVIELHI